MNTSNKNVMVSERERFEMFRTTLKEIPDEEDFEKFWYKSEAMDEN